MQKTRIALLFGGVSSEHEVSCVSCGLFVRSLDPERYHVLCVGITRGGQWLLTPADPEAMADGSWQNDPANRRCILSPDHRDHGFLLFESEDRVRPCYVDVVIPVLHGRNGEDGTIQGLLELAALPYVGCGVLASANCMDKAVANTLFDAAGLPQCPWAWCTRREAADFEALAARLEAQLGYPLFVKPANGGSSVGISRVQNRDELEYALRLALREDDKAVFEAAANGQEVECAVLGNDELLSTRPGEILAGEEFYTYDDKYKNGVAQTLIPARLSEEKLDEIKALAEKAYRALGCTGLARCDFFVEHGTGRVLINEINTMPGFTSISMYPMLMEAAGLPPARLLDRLIELALEKAGVQHG